MHLFALALARTHIVSTHEEKKYNLPAACGLRVQYQHVLISNKKHVEVEEVVEGSFVNDGER